MKRKVTVAYDLDHPDPTVAEWLVMLEGLPDEATVSATPIMGGDQRDPFPVGLRVRITTRED